MTISFLELYNTTTKDLQIINEKVISLYKKLNEDYKYFAPNNNGAYQQFIEIFKVCEFFGQNQKNYYQESYNLCRDDIFSSNAYTSY